MVEIYRIEKGAEAWKYKAYDYVRTDAFCVGQGIPIELEFSHDEKEEELQAVLLVEDHKPVAGCRIAFPNEKTGKIERVCVVREKQKGGYGRKPCWICPAVYSENHSRFWKMGPYGKKYQDSLQRDDSRKTKF